MYLYENMIMQDINIVNSSSNTDTQYNKISINEKRGTKVTDSVNAVAVKESKITDDVNAVKTVNIKKEKITDKVKAVNVKKDKFPVVNVTLTDELLLLNDPKQLGRFYTEISKFVNDILKSHVFTLATNQGNAKRISLLELLLNPNELYEWYGTPFKEASVGQDLTADIKIKGNSALGALVLRFNRIQCKIFTIFTMLDRQSNPLLADKRLEIIRLLKTSTFYKDGSMLKPLPGQVESNNVTIILATLKRITTLLIPVEFLLRELLTVLNHQSYDFHYNPWNSEHVHYIINMFAPYGFTSPQKDLYYVIASIARTMKLDPHQAKQKDQYCLEICQLINAISLQPNPSWDMLTTHFSTQAINLPVDKFFDLKGEIMSNMASRL